MDGAPSDTWNETRPAQSRFYTGGKTLGEGEYFFLGDNPPESRDSRHFGAVQGENVEGRVVWSLRGMLGFGPVR
jgi:type IV secretory pathway protease TraF